MPDERPPDDPASSSRPGSPRLAATETYVELMERLAPGALVAGRYRIVSIAGVGGMGVVYRARDEELRVDVALKVLRQDLGSDPRAIERFRGELLSARQVTHKNVVRLHDIGEHEGLRFLTMDFVEGRSLREILEREGPLPLEKAAAMLRQVAEGLEAAHEKGIVHRDLKPGNILIDAEGRAFITDFGIARSLGRDGMTRAGAIVGTPDYLAPEQVSGDPVDGRTDLYALGIVFYEALSGELPFRGDSQTEALAQRLAGRPRDLKETGVSAPSWAREIIRRCLERSPARRYPTARALLEDLDRRAPSALRRPRPSAILAGAAALLLLAAGAWVLLRPRAAPGPASKAAGRPASAAPLHSVAVLPFADQTGDASLAWAGRGVAEMVSASLAESPSLRVLDSTRVERGVQDLRVAAGPLESAAGKQLADLWSVDTLVAGAVRKAGARVRLDVSVLQFPPAGPAASQTLSAEGAGEADIFQIAGTLARDLKGRLGASSPAVLKDSGARTASLAAEKAYEEGRAALSRGDELTAAPAFEGAVAADPRFAAALEKLAQTYQILGRHEKAVEASERALSAVGTADTLLSRRIRARVALVNGKPADAETLFRHLLQLYPNSSEARMDLAGAQAAQGHNADAVATLKKLVESDPHDPQAWLLLGRNAILMGDTAKAVQDYLVRALALQSQSRNEKGKADVYVATAGAYQRMGDYPRALENYAAAWKIQTALGDERGLATTLRNRSLVYQFQGKVKEAEADLQSARALFEKLGDRLGVADAWNASGVLEESRGAYTRALEAYQNALKLRRELGNERLLAQSYDNVGYIYYLQGEYDNALVYWQQALDLRRKISHKSGVVLSVLNMGFLQTAQGRWDDAVKSFAESLEKSRETGQKDATAISLGNLGILHRLRGRFSAALSSFDEALAVAREMQYQGASIEFTLKKASLLLELGRGSNAAGLLSQAEKWVAETGNDEQKADLEVLRGDIALERGDRAAARSAYEKAVPLARKSGSRMSLLKARLAGALAASEGPGPLASILAEAESLGHVEATLDASEALASVELSRRKFADADRVLQKAVAAAERVGWNEGLYRLHALRGKALQGSGDRAAAAGELRRSAEAAGKLRENVPAEMRASFDALPLVKEVTAAAWRAAQ